MSEQTPEPELPSGDDPKAWLDFLTNLDPKNKRRLMIGLGAAAAFGLGVGVYKISKNRGGGTFFIRHGDRYMEKKGIISIGERVNFGAAASVPQDGASHDALAAANDPEVFLMDDAGVVRPFVDERTMPRYLQGLGRMRDIVMDEFRRRLGSEPPEQ